MKKQKQNTFWWLILGGGSNCKFWEKNPQVYLVILREWPKILTPYPPHFKKSRQFWPWCILPPPPPFLKLATNNFE